MAFDRHGTGLTLLRILLGLFFLFQGLGNVRWLVDSSVLSQQLTTWERTVGAGSISAQYLHRVAIPYAGVFARLVPLGELSVGLAMIVGLWTPFFAFIAFVMVLNVHIASGAIFTYGFLRNPYGLPMLGGTLALLMGGAHLPWSIR